MALISRPTKFPRWADAAADPIPGSVGIHPITEPSEAKKDQGWVIEKQPLGVLNWLQNLVYQWIQYFDDMLLRLGTPVGGVMFYAKSMAGTPALVKGFVEMNGQTLSDPESIYNGLVIPNVNGDPSGADTFSNGKVAVFLRGGTVSGTYQANQNKSHTHVQNAHTHTQNSHTHTQNSHTHSVSGGAGTSMSFDSFSCSSYGSGISGSPTSQVGPVGSVGYLTATGVLSFYTSLSLGAGSTTATNQSATATNQNATATNQNDGGTEARPECVSMVAIMRVK